MAKRYFVGIPLDKKTSKELKTTNSYISLQALGVQSPAQLKRTKQVLSNISKRNTDFKMEHNKEQGVSFKSGRFMELQKDVHKSLSNVPGAFDDVLYSPKVENTKGRPNYFPIERIDKIRLYEKGPAGKYKVLASHNLKNRNKFQIAGDKFFGDRVKEAGFVEDRKNDAKYFGYLARHKYNVYKGGRELGVDRWPLIKHDWSKLKPSIWVPYREHFFGDGNNKNFREAVKEHSKLERHHDYKYNNPTGKILPNRENYADWWAVNKESNPNIADIKTWIEKNAFSIKHTKIFKSLKGFDDTGKLFYPKIRKATIGAIAVPFPASAPAAISTYAGLTGATIGATKMSTKYPRLYKNLMQTSKTLAG